MLTRTLSDLMDFDHPIQVHPDGSVTDAPEGTYAPEVHEYEEVGDSPGLASVHVDAGWTLLHGYSGQHGYPGPVMHPSEYIGGRLERDILAEPGIYVAVVVTYDGGMRDEDCGWAVARKDEA